MDSIILWAVGTFAVVGALGLAVMRFGSAGFRTKVYAQISSLLTLAATLGAFALSQADLLAQIGLDAPHLAAITLAAKLADWLNQIWLRNMTSTPAGLDVHPDTVALEAAKSTAAEVATPAVAAAITQAADAAKANAEAPV